MDPDQDSPDRIRIFGRSGSGLRKKSLIRIRTKGPGSETLSTSTNNREISCDSWRGGGKNVLSKQGTHAGLYSYNSLQIIIYSVVTKYFRNFFFRGKANFLWLIILSCFQRKKKTFTKIWRKKHFRRNSNIHQDISIQLTFYVGTNLAKLCLLTY